MSKIELTDSLQDVMEKMAEGDPGALQTLCEILKQAEKIDPQGAMGGLGPILSLDTLGIYGSDIYILYNDQCRRNVRELLMILRANQLGFISSEKVKAVVADQIGQVKFSKEKMDDLNDLVCERLDSFQKRAS